MIADSSSALGTDLRISERIKLAMQLRGMSMAELAERAGIPYRSLQDNVNEKNRFSAATVAKLASALDISADWILLGKAAPLDPAIVALNLEMIEDIRGLSGHKVSFDECAAIFVAQYGRDVFEPLRRLPSLEEQRRARRAHLVRPRRRRQ